MAEEKVWAKEFLEYEEFIANHPNYKGLPITKGKGGKYNWIATGQSEVGKKRKAWAEKKGREIGIDVNSSKFYSEVMLAIHPTKTKPCQICGKSMSLYYHYPNANLVKAFKKEFNYECDVYESIYDICDNLKKHRITEKQIINFLKNKCKLDDNYTDLDTLICHCELKCRNGLSKMLGPGAMSNFPDRYDGFHTYNRCCRSTEDKGRSKENLRTYGKDRRAYEYFSDGNIHAADRFMNSKFFEGKSADHIIPVSLGGVHDSHYLQPMSTGDNSSKRDRLVKDDVLKAIDIETKSRQKAVSWFVFDLWEYLKRHVKSFAQTDFENFRVCLKQNMTDFLNVLCLIKQLDNEIGIEFITEILLKPKYKYFEIDYDFNADGSYSKKNRHITERASDEFERMKRISLDSLDEYDTKDNRNMTADFSEREKVEIDEICQTIQNKNFSKANNLLVDLMRNIQERLLNDFLR